MKVRSMETPYIIIVLYIFLELFEVQWQKAANMMGMMMRMYRVYHQNILHFFVLHPTFYFAIWLVMSTEYQPAAVIMLLIKTLDLVIKVLFIQQLFERHELPPEMEMMMQAPLHPLLPYIGLALYTPLVFMTLF